MDEQATYSFGLYGRDELLEYLLRIMPLDGVRPHHEYREATP